jgi:hypothetical protein
VATDGHDQIHGCSIQKLIGTKRPPTGMRGDPLTLSLGFHHHFISFFIEMFNGLKGLGQSPHFLYVEVEIRITDHRDVSIKEENKDPAGILP